MKKCFYFVLLAAIAFAGCKKNDETTKQSFSIDAKSIILTDGEAGTKEIALRCENLVPTVASDSEDWLTAEITARMLTVTFSRNESGSERTGILTISPGKLEPVTVTVQQPVYVAPAPPSEDDLKLGSKTEDGLGVIYWVDQTNRKIGKAISLGRVNNTAWSTLTEESGATSRVNGAANTAIMAAKENAEGTYPAAYYCANMGKGWYVPALNELLEIYDIYNGVSHIDATAVAPELLTPDEKAARATFDGWLTAEGGEAMNTAESGNGQSYWSSTEYNDTYPYYVRFGKFAIGGEDQDVKKTSAKEQRYVRCMKVIGDFTYPAEPPTLSLKPATLNFNGAADSKEVIATVTNGEISSVVSGDDSWCTATVSGSTITVSVIENATGESRSTTVDVNVAGTEENLTKQITVNQKPLGGFKIGDVYKEKDVAVGVVFWTSDDAQTAKIISLTRSEKSAWALAETAAATTLIGATDPDDGASNYAKIVAFVGASTSDCPMIAFCNSLGSGWYIPAAGELQALFAAYNGTTWTGGSAVTYANLPEAEKKARDAFDKILTDNGGTVIDDHSQTNGDQYLASTEVSAIEVNSVRFGKKALNSDTGKTGTSRYFRAVKQVTAE